MPYGSSAPTSSGPNGAKGNNQSKNIQASGRLLLGACLFIQYRLHFIGDLPSNSSDSVGDFNPIPKFHPKKCNFNHLTPRVTHSTPNALNPFTTEQQYQSHQPSPVGGFAVLSK